MLPLQYPDLCIFLELISEERGNKKQLAQAYVYNINRKYLAIVSSLTYGEISRGLIKMIKEDRKREIAFHKMNDVLRDLVPCSPQFEDLELALELRKIDYNIEPADALHLAIAMNKKAQIFVTFGERKLVNNEKVKQFCKEKNLKIERLG